MVIMEAMDLTLQQAADLLDAYRKEHKLARIVDPDECRELDIGEGSCQYGRPCHAVWGSNHRCSNCISYQACHTDKERRKQELRNRQLFEITSRPVNLHVDAATTLVASLELIDWREATPAEVADIPEKDNDNADFLNQHDTLTGLFNKEGFSRAVRAELAAQPDTDFTMVSINLRKFHMINDLYSMKKGDEVLVSVAESIRQKCHTGALIARLFGDHFAVFEPTDETLEARLQEFLDEALFVIEEDDIPLHIHAGIYSVVDRGLPVAIMIDRADMARKEIENDYNIGSAHYTKKLWETAINKQEMVNRFTDALAQDEFHLYLQPQLDRKEKLAAAEVLVRWIKGDGSIVSPGAFIPCFEESGQIAQLDRFVWEKTVQLLKSWEGTAFSDLALSINVSPKDFLYLDVAKTLQELIEKYDLPMEKLRVEITESAVVSQSKMVDDIIDAGFHVEIDDFGKGYSSLNTLRNIRAKTLKLDMFFLRFSDETKTRGRVIVDHVIHMGKTLGMQIVAEGVETEFQKNHLLKADCDYLQGFLFSPPIPVEAFVKKYAAC